MRGKYSPTVTAAYIEDQEWFIQYRDSISRDENAYLHYDPDGFDSYGYNKDDVDRAGIHENNYAHNDGDYDKDEDYNIAYDNGLRYWGFDGTKPIRKNFK